MTIETDKPSGVFVIIRPAIRTEVLLADLTPTTLILKNDSLAGASEFMGLRGVDQVAVSIGFFELLGYHFGLLSTNL